MLPIFQQNGIESFQAAYQDPKAFMSNISKVCFIEDLSLPVMEEGSDMPATPLFEFASGSHMRELTNDARTQTGNPAVEVFGIAIFEDAATLGKRGCRSASPLSWTTTIFSSELRNSSQGKPKTRFSS